MTRRKSPLRRVLGLAAVVTAGLVALCEPAPAAEDARGLVTDAWARMRALETERETLTVLVIASPDKPGYRAGDLADLKKDGRRGVIRKSAVRSIRYATDGHDKLHIVFSEPAEDRGTGFLVWRQPDASQDDQWLYMPALKRVRRVPSSSTQTFVGSDFNYEDIRSLTSEPVERFDYAVVGTETVDGQPCTLVRATPKAGTTSAYAGRTIALATTSLFPLRTTFEDADGRPWKILTNVDPHEVAPRVLRPELTEMRDLKLGETTVIAFEARDVNVPLPPALFTQDFLERGTGE